MIRNEVNRFYHLNALRRCNKSEWAAPSFRAPKKNGQIWFISDFCQLKQMDCLPTVPNAKHLPTIQMLWRVYLLYCTWSQHGFPDNPSRHTFATPVHDHLTLGKVLLPPSSNGTSLFTRHIPRENVRTIHQHDLHVSNELRAILCRLEQASQNQLQSRHYDWYAYPSSPLPHSVTQRHTFAFSHCNEVANSGRLRLDIKVRMTLQQLCIPLPRDTILHSHVAVTL
jgi:hypothetical protein